MQANLTYRGTSYPCSQAQARAASNQQQFKVQGMYRGADTLLSTELATQPLPNTLSLTYRGAAYVHASLTRFASAQMA